MTPAKLLQLIKELKVIEIKKDCYLFKQGEQGNQAYVLLDGEILLFEEDPQLLKQEESDNLLWIQQNQKLFRGNSKQRRSAVLMPFLEKCLNKPALNPNGELRYAKSAYTLTKYKGQLFGELVLLN